MDKKKVVKTLTIIAWASAFTLLLVIYLFYSGEQNRKKEEYLKALKEQEINQEILEENPKEDPPLEEDKKVEIYEADAFDLLNTPLKLFEKKIGLGKTIADTDELFYEKAGVYIKSDEEKDIVGIRLEDNGTSEARISALGLFIGNSYNKAKELLKEKGIEHLELSEKSLMGNFYLGDKMDRLYSIVITSEDERITQIRVYSTNVE